MKGERVGSTVEATRTFGDTILEIPQFRPSNLSQLIPTNSKYKKIKLPPLVFPSACIRGQNSPPPSGSTSDPIASSRA
jgi:hypothetical protein